MPGFWEAGAITGDDRRQPVLQRLIGHEQHCDQHQAYDCQKSESRHRRVPTACTSTLSAMLSPVVAVGRVGPWTYVCGAWRQRGSTLDVRHDLKRVLPAARARTTRTFSGMSFGRYYALVLSFGGQMRRRDFISLLGVTAASTGASNWAMWPLAARAQQPAVPVIGFLNSGSPRPYQHLVAGFQQGLKETGYVEGQNVLIEYRWAEGQNDRLPAMMADLVRQVNVIAATTTPAALAAEAANTTIPTIFNTAGDPVRLGLVARLNRPGRNVSGVSQLNSELVAKRLGLLHDLIPKATIIGFLVNPGDPRTKTKQGT